MKKATIEVCFEDVLTEATLQYDFSGEKIKKIEENKKELMNWIDHNLFQYCESGVWYCIENAIKQFIKDF